MTPKSEFGSRVKFFFWKFSLEMIEFRVIIYKKKVPFFYFLLQKLTSIFFLEILERSPKTLRPSFFGPQKNIFEPAVMAANRQANRWESDGESSDDDDDDLPRRKKRCLMLAALSRRRPNAA